MWKGGSAGGVRRCPRRLACFPRGVLCILVGNVCMGTEQQHDSNTHTRRPPSGLGGIQRGWVAICIDAKEARAAERPSVRPVGALRPKPNGLTVTAKRPNNKRKGLRIRDRAVRTTEFLADTGLARCPTCSQLPPLHCENHPGRNLITEAFAECSLIRLGLLPPPL